MEKKEIMRVPSLEELLESGLHFGHQVTRWNPKMDKFIFQRKEGMHVIDLVQTQQRLKEACQFVQKLSQSNKKILFVGTKKQAVQIVKQYAVKTKMPYIVNRWIGGLLTNYKIVSQNIKKLNQLKSDLDNKEFVSRYTKKEINEFKLEYADLFNLYEGVKDLTQLPDALFIIDAHHEKTVVLEANKIKIPVIALLDTNSNPDLINYPIPGNDDSFKSIELITKTISETIGIKTE